MRRAVALATLLLATACAGGTTDSTLPDAAVATTAPVGPPYDFASWKTAFVDPSRPTEPGVETPGAPIRTLDTTIYLPEGTEPRPLIVFSHGLVGHPDKFTALLSAWARAGYVVAAPAFPLTNDRVPGAPRNFDKAFSQPDDVSFVLDEMLRLDGDPSSPLFERIDADAIGAAGLSLGGGTTYAVTFSICCRDTRIRAAEVFAGAQFPLLGEMDLDGHVPLLIVHGDQDPALRYELAVDAYESAAAPVSFVTLIGAAHAPAFENDVTPHDAMVEQLTTDFWDATIGGDPDAVARFEQHAVVDGLSTLQSK
jgi:dienelactone hydrolase